MWNTMLPENEVTLVKEIIDKVNTLIEKHTENKFTLEDFNTSSAKRLHTVMYVDLLREFLESAQALDGLLEVSEEEFVEVVTEKGKLSLEEAEKRMMIRCLMEMITH